MAYFAIGMALYSPGSYEELLSRLTDGLSWTSCWEQSFTAPSKSAIFQARQRLGPELLAALFARVAKPIGTPGTAGVWLGTTTCAKALADCSAKRRNPRRAPARRVRR